MSEAGQLNRELVEDVCRVAETGQQDQGPSLTTPIEHFEADTFVHLDESHVVR